MVAGGPTILIRSTHNSYPLMYYRVLSMYYHVLSTFRIIRGNTLYYVCIISVLLYDSSVLCESTVTARNTCIM